MRTVKTIIQLVFIFGCLPFAQAQRANNVEARFIEGKIHVSCLLQATSPVDLTLHWSDNGGLSFNPSITVEGDLINQTSGMKTIVWDCSKEGIIMGDFIFKITCLPSNQRVVASVTEQQKREIERENDENKVTDNIYRNPSRTTESPSRTTETTMNRKITGDRTGATIPIKKSRFLVMAGIAIGPAFSGTFTAGFMPGKIGSYAKIKSNFGTKGDAQTGSIDEAFYIDNFSKTGRFSISAGLTGQIANMLFINVGVGYGSKWVQWKTTSGQLITIDEMSISGIDPELGLILKTGNFLIGAGVNTLIGSKITTEANISIGFIF